MEVGPRLLVLLSCVLFLHYFSNLLPSIYFQLHPLMASHNDDILHDFPPFFKVFKDGRILRHDSFDGANAPIVPPGVDPLTGIQTKDVVFSPESGVSARIFLPSLAQHSSSHKLPLLVHYHGGGFCIGSALDVITHRYITSLVTLTSAVVVSVEYRLAPENPLPIAYDDSFAALQWIASHSTRRGPEPWLNQYPDLDRVFITGESAGANIAHHVTVRAGATGLAGVKIVGMILLHPFFGTSEEDKMYRFMCPTSSGRDDDPKLNPGEDPNLSKMGCEKVLVCVAGKDGLKERGVKYYETLRKSEWGGRVDLIESEGEDHCFHMFNPNSERVGPLFNLIAEFVMKY
ncbi:probable carboxylesterase 1 [Prosopis cineraria]|uniref:probable carboxylesterase 1 n=1 Tax=Prosopis cineraria TaxID=364024 RepID=UPI00240F6B63|nr:probable carboxylesterase 1 [Prosopis cineraria]